MLRRPWRSQPRLDFPLVAGKLSGIAVVAIVLASAGSVRAQVANKPKVFVFPYQVIYRDVPKDITTQTSDLLKKEIKQNDELQLQKGPIFIPEAVVGKVKPLSDKDLRRAEKYLARGERQYKNLELNKATRSFQLALTKYEKSISLLQDFDSLVKTMLMLSVCYYRRDREDDGAKMLVKVIRLRPEIKLDPATYPPMFRNTLDALRKRLLRKTRGELEVLANADQALVFFDGQKVGKAPLLLKDLVPGEHYVRVEKEGLQTYAGKISVVPTKKVRFSAMLGGIKTASGPLGNIANAIRNNDLVAAVIPQIRKEGQKIGADIVLAGGIAKVGSSFRVGSFFVRVKTGQICPLPEKEFDAEMLGASVEVFNLIEEFVKRAEGCREPRTPPYKIVETASQKETKMTVAKIGPARPAPNAVGAQPALGGSSTRSVAVPAVPAKSAATSATPRRPARVGTSNAQPATPQVTAEGMATLPSSSQSNKSGVRREQIVIPQPPMGQEVPIPVPNDENIENGHHWYKTWWFWTVVGVVAAGTTGSALYLGGVFDADASSGSVDVIW